MGDPVGRPYRVVTVVNIAEQLIIERAFGPAVAEQYEQGRLPERLLAPIANAASTLSLRFTNREHLERGYLKDRDLRLAYLLYYLPSNLPKTGFLLNELEAHPDGLFSGRQLRMLDMGAGQGAATLGVLQHFAERGAFPEKLEITALDLNSQPLEDYRTTYPGLVWRISLRQLRLTRRISKRDCLRV
jgi:hypothetical protein